MDLLEKLKNQANDDDDDDEFVPDEKDGDDDEHEGVEDSEEATEKSKPARGTKRKIQARKQKGVVDIDEQDSRKLLRTEDHIEKAELQTVVKKDDIKEENIASDSAIIDSEAQIDELWNEMQMKSEPQKPTIMNAPKPATAATVKTFKFAGEKVAVPVTNCNSTNKNNLGALVAGLKKKNLSTLDKSRLDWVNFKDKTGIQDDLTHHLKDGYLDKVAFLQRADEKQNEQLRALRQKQRKPK